MINLFGNKMTFFTPMKEEIKQMRFTLITFQSISYIDLRNLIFLNFNIQPTMFPRLEPVLSIGVHLHQSR